MDVDEIRKLVRLMEEAGLTELEVEDRSGTIRLVRGAAPRAPRADAAEEERPDDERVSRAGVDGAALDGTAQAASAAPDGATLVTSPMVGTFYRAPAPDAEPFVHAGDVVHVGQVLCIIEAMKMMNEIHAEADGRIVRIEAENGSPVEYGSPLFVVAPLE